MNIERLYRTIANIIERREDVKIEFEIGLEEKQEAA